jgi:hypothetical protein
MSDNPMTTREFCLSLEYLDWHVIDFADAAGISTRAAQRIYSGQNECPPGLTIWLRATMRWCEQRRAWEADNPRPVPPARPEDVA